MTIHILSNKWELTGGYRITRCGFNTHDSISTRVLYPTAVKHEGALNKWFLNRPTCEACILLHWADPSKTRVITNEEALYDTLSLNLFF